MSYSLALSGGDLVQQGSTLAVVHGVEKLKQDLQLWVLERWGGDRFHPGMGSVLQDMIGGVIDGSTAFKIRKELERVLDNYQRVQWDAFRDNPRLYSTTELLFAIDDISISVGFDVITAVVKVRTAAGEAAAINLTQGL